MAAFEEGVSLYRSLAADNPAYLGEMARSLNNLGLSLHTQGRHEEELTSRTRALEVLRSLGKTNPGAYENLYKRQVAALRRTLDRHGRNLEATSLHLDEAAGDEAETTDSMDAF